MDPLPIDAVLPEVVGALRRDRCLVLEAPPGAGKTTRVPRAILEAGLAGDGEVLVLEPRRLAARMAAGRVAEELGEKPGETVGWQVRFEDVSGPRTRIRFVTEALVTRRLLSRPTLPEVGAVVLDEFHERSLAADLALALLQRLRTTARPDLALVVMSATLDAAGVARFLGTTSLASEGRLFPVAIEFLSPEEAARDLRLEVRVAAAVRRVLREEPDGHVLVFLPGAAEIRRAREALEGSTGADLLPLHGDLPPEEQDRAVRPSARRKVILSTNVAETSVTIDGVVAVVDSGLARVATHSPWSGLPTLELRRVSRASAAQRTGRAGRTRPGRCLRLYTRHDHDTRPEHDLPEIRREDLAETALHLAGLDLAASAANGACPGPGGLAWLDPPPAAAWDAALALLARLGALDPAGHITPLGRRMLRFPLHPRLARLMVAAEDAGVAAGGALLAALLAERPILAPARSWERPGGTRAPRDAPTGPSDLLELASLFEEAARARFAEGALRSLGLVPGAVQAVDRARRQLERLARGPSARSPSPARPAREPGGPDAEEALLRATLAAFPDRVARRRAPRSDEVVLAGGGSARLAAESVVREAPLLAAVEVGERLARAGAARPGTSGATVRLASAVTPEMLLDLFPESLRYEEELRWNGAAERVDAIERLAYGGLALEEGRSVKADEGRAAALLAGEALARGPRAFAPEGELDRLLARLRFAARHSPESGVREPDEEELRAALRELCAGRRSFAELREEGLHRALLGRLPPPQRAALDRTAPERVALPGGRQVKVQYGEGDQPAWIESRLQDFFGMAEGPRLAGGRVPLVLHLLAPNGRAQQVTTDLAGFWERHYPPLRRELMRRYPRHAWPEDPLRAQPPAPRRPR